MQILASTFLNPAYFNPVLKKNNEFVPLGSSTI